MGLYFKLNSLLFWFYDIKFQVTVPIATDFCGFGVGWYIWCDLHHVLISVRHSIV